MKPPMNPDEIEIDITEIKDKPGKPIVVVFGNGTKVLSDIRCLDKNGKRCNECQLKFRCYTCNNLELNFEKDLRCQASDELESTLSELIEGYLKAKNRRVDN